MRSTKRLALLSLAGIVCAALFLPNYSAPRANAAVDRLPDLGMLHPSDIHVTKTTDGRRLLRFTSIIVNVGDGRFELNGTRPPGSSAMTLQQRVYDDSGGHRDISTPATAFFAGDGHSHWHVTNLEDVDLTRLDNGRLVGTGAKRGFCFYDNYRYTATTPGFYPPENAPCGSSATNTSVKMGLSVGWGDVYSASLPDQFIDITDLTAGRYRLRVAADGDNWFLEQDEQNNYSWVDLQFRGNSVKVTGYGPRV